ncbi:hypothetical protein ACH5RR_007983 [Cinchona calisaya]|uniref:Uncharacterized protein n=1 Tax=Cinchona calisaya TaxID=153742 RepID=A0ABD3AA31_9GENT
MDSDGILKGITDPTGNFGLSDVGAELQHPLHLTILLYMHASNERALLYATYDLEFHVWYQSGVRGLPSPNRNLEKTMWDPSVARVNGQLAIQNGNPGLKLTALKSKLDNMILDRVNN